MSATYLQAGPWATTLGSWPALEPHEEGITEHIYQEDNEEGLGLEPDGKAASAEAWLGACSVFWFSSSSLHPHLLPNVHLKSEFVI